jgi:hypothetical protein
MNNNHQQLTRILALDLHPASFGYALFDGVEVFYWGTRRWMPDKRGRTVPGISRLMDAWDPMQIVIREGAPSRQIADIKRIARKSKVPVAMIRRSLERRAFGASCANRFDRAAAIASRYAPLQGRMSKKRQPWEREPYQIRLFNAIAAGMAYLQDKPGMASIPTTQTPSP